jgi:hypothetical protein
MPGVLSMPGRLLVLPAACPSLPGRVVRAAGAAAEGAGLPGRATAGGARPARRVGAGARGAPAGPGRAGRPVRCGRRPRQLLGAVRGTSARPPAAATSCCQTRAPGLPYLARDRPRSRMVVASAAVRRAGPCRRRGCFSVRRHGSVTTHQASFASSPVSGPGDVSRGPCAGRVPDPVPAAPGRPPADAGAAARFRDLSPCRSPFPPRAARRGTGRPESRPLNGVPAARVMPGRSRALLLA